jgi:hypothetical protein
MKFLLISLLMGSLSAQAKIIDRQDDCYDVVTKFKAALIESFGRPVTAQASIESEAEDRSYTISVKSQSGWTTHYELILSNDSAEKCMFVTLNPSI